LKPRPLCAPGVTAGIFIGAIAWDVSEVRS
jgi:hypothetical protein